MTKPDYDTPMSDVELDRHGYDKRTLMRDFANKLFKHKNGKSYRVVGVAWFGDTDEWAVLHVDEYGNVFVRTAANFFAEGRFEAVAPEDDMAAPGTS